MINFHQLNLLKTRRVFGRVKATLKVSCRNGICYVPLAATLKDLSILSTSIFLYDCTRFHAFVKILEMATVDP